MRPAKLTADLIITSIGGNQLPQLSGLLAALILKDLDAVHSEKFICRLDPCYPMRLTHGLCHILIRNLLSVESRVSFGNPLPWRSRCPLNS